ncbi:type II toxin-antitoxin system RelE/ParE family toxin [Candidatus Bipolaricaulota bacterium]|nr:type II toxin-antitoxin system RelE/ParE family toxin [Candidatus Bipolaricaulota bacterium]
MAGWTLRYDPRVRKELERVRDKQVIERLKSAAETLKDEPFSGKPLRGYPGVWSKRVGTKGGEWRIIYMPLKSERVLLVVLIAPREEVYELLKRGGRRSREL